ncbi:MAG: transglutaminase family protein, partial [Fimbriimonadales bacterium]|nr:transglutaminase family protein [Fimbriimonadales bacterium]
FVAQQGYCTEFATALAVMCQYAGLSARVASGYLLTERDPQTGEYVVRDRHRHLWTEVYFSGIGWVPFDATQNAPVINGGNLTGSDSASDHSRTHPFLRWQRLLDGLIIAGMLYLLWSLVASKRFWLHAGIPARAGQLYARLVYLLRLIGCPAPHPYQSPGDYLDSCAATLRSGGHDPALAARRARLTREIVALQEPVLRLLYAPAAEAVALEAMVQGKIKALQRQVRQEIGYARLMGRAIALKWHDWFALPDPQNGEQAHIRSVGGDADAMGVARRRDADATPGGRAEHDGG